MYSVIIHDTRLAGYVPWYRGGFQIVVDDEHASVSGIFRRAFTAGSLHEPGRLVIMAHGLRTRDGHFYVEMGEGLTVHNVSAASCLRGAFRKIKFKACGTTEAGCEAEMMALYTQLARAAQTPVIASEIRQEYVSPGQPLDGVQRALGVLAIDFGEWEGRVWEYPVRGPRRLVHGPSE